MRSYRSFCSDLTEALFEEEEEEEEEKEEVEEERSSRAFAFVGLASVRRAKHTHVEKPSPGNEDAAWAVGAVSLVHVESQ